MIHEWDKYDSRNQQYSSPIPWEQAMLPVFKSSALAVQSCNASNDQVLDDGKHSRLCVAQNV